MTNELKRCPYCGKDTVTMFDSDNDWCHECKKIFLPGASDVNVKDTLMCESTIGDIHIIGIIGDVSQNYRDKEAFFQIIKDLANRGLIVRHVGNNNRMERIAELETERNKFRTALKDVAEALYNSCPTCEYSCMSWPECCNDGCDIHIALGIANKALEVGE